MRSISLMVYAVRIKTVGTRRDYELLDSFSEKGADLLDVLRNILNQRKNEKYDKQDSQQVLEVDKAESDGRQIEGIVNLGGYGTAGPIRDRKSWTVVYKKKVGDVDLRPFYFLFDLPEGKDLGFALLQRTGAEGIQSILAEALEDPFNREFPNCRVRMLHYTPEALLKELQRQQVSEIKFIRHRVPRDIATLIGPATTEQISGTMDLTVKFRERGVGLPAIRRFLEAHRGTDNILELEDLRFPWEDVKIKVKFKGKERTMDLGDPASIRPSFDVSEDLEWSSTGHPTFDSISVAAKQLLSELKSPPVRKNP